MHGFSTGGKARFGESREFTRAAGKIPMKPRGFRHFGGILLDGSAEQF